MTLNTNGQGEIVLARKHNYAPAALIAQCDRKASRPADLALWDAAKPADQEVW